GDENRRAGVGDPAEEIVDRGHGGAGADEVAEARRFLDDAPEVLHLLAQAPVLDGTLERHHEGVDLDRLGDEVVGAGADGGDRRLERPERRDDDGRHVRTGGDDLLAQLQAVHALQPGIRDDDVEVLLAQYRHCLCCGGAPRDRESAFAERGLKRLAHAAIVIDEQHAPGHDASLSSAGCSRTGGRNTVNEAPWPGSFDTVTEPPCSCTMACTTARPRPVPSPTGLRVENGARTWSRGRGATPGPSPVTRIHGKSACESARPREPPGRPCPTSIRNRPPRGIAWMPFTATLVTTCWSCVWSAHTSTGRSGSWVSTWTPCLSASGSTIASEPFTICRTSTSSICAPWRRE